MRQYRCNSLQKLADSRFQTFFLSRRGNNHMITLPLNFSATDLASLNFHTTTTSHTNNPRVQKRLQKLYKPPRKISFWIESFEQKLLTNYGFRHFGMKLFSFFSASFQPIRWGKGDLGDIKSSWGANWSYSESRSLNIRLEHLLHNILSPCPFLPGWVISARTDR